MLTNIIVSLLIPNTSFLGHLCGIAIGYACKLAYSLTFKSFYEEKVTKPPPLVGLGYLKILLPPEKILRWIENKLNLLGRLPHYVSVDQKTYGRYGILPSGGNSSDRGMTMNYIGSSQRLGP